MRLVYPSEPPDLSDKATLFELCLVVDKYCFRTQPLPVVVALKTLAEKELELAYIYACRLGLPDVARRAAEASLRKPKLFKGVRSDGLYVEDRWYHNFAMYQRHCLEAATATVRDMHWMLTSATSTPTDITVNYTPTSNPCKCAEGWVPLSTTKYTSVRF